MEDILSQMSFDEGIAMPIANEENKQYEAEVYAYFDRFNLAVNKVYFPSRYHLKG